MNTTGDTTADMLFTGMMMVLHLAFLVALGYALGWYRGFRKGEKAEDDLTECKRRMEKIK